MFKVNQFILGPVMSEFYSNKFGNKYIHSYIDYEIVFHYI